MNLNIKGAAIAVATFALVPIATAQDLSPGSEAALEKLGFGAGPDAIFAFDTATETEGAVILEKVTITNDDTIEFGRFILTGLGDDDGESLGLDSLVVEEISIPETEDSDGYITIDAIRVGEPNAALFDDLFLKVLRDDFESIDFEAWSTSGVSIEGLKMFSDSDGELVDLTLDQIGFSSGETGLLDQLTMSGLSLAYAGADGTLSAGISSFELAGIKPLLTDVFRLGMIEELEDRDEDLVAQLRDAEADNLAEPGYDRFEISGVRLDIVGLVFDLPSLTSTVERNEAGDATAAVFEPFRAVLGADPSQEVGAMLTGILGFLGVPDGIVMSGYGKTRYVPETNTLLQDTSENVLNFEGLMSASYGFEWSGIQPIYRLALDFLDERSENASAEELEAALEPLDLSNLTIVLADYGLIDSALQLYALQQASDPETARLQLKGMLAFLPLGLSEFGVDAVLSNRLATGLSNFLDGNSEVTLSFDPDPSINGLEFLQPDTLNDARLGFTAVNTPFEDASPTTE